MWGSSKNIFRLASTQKKKKITFHAPFLKNLLKYLLNQNEGVIKKEKD